MGTAYNAKQYCKHGSFKLRNLTKESDSIFYIMSLFTKAFQVVPIATKWLDEVTEGLKLGM